LILGWKGASRGQARSHVLGFECPFFPVSPLSFLRNWLWPATAAEDAYVTQEIAVRARHRFISGPRNEKERGLKAMLPVQCGRRRIVGAFALCALAGALAACARAQGTTPQMEQSDQIARFHLSNGQYLVDRGEYLEANAEFAAARDTAQSLAVRAEAVSWLGQMAASFLDNPGQAAKQYREIVEKYRDSEFYSGAMFQL